MPEQGWKSEFRALLLFLGLSLLAGHLLDARLQALLIALGLYLVWHLYHLLRLGSALAHGKTLKLRPPPGLWGDIYNGIRDLQDGVRRRKRRLGRFLKRFRATSAALPEAIILLAHKGNVEWANPAAERLLGVRYPQHANRPLRELIDHPVFREYLENRNFSQPLEFPSPTDQTVMLSLELTSFSKTNQHLLLARDITRVYHLDISQRDFVSNVSHELRTPLTVFQGYVETLQDGLGDSPEWGRSLVHMQQQTERMRSLVNDLLTLSRLEMQQSMESEVAVPVAELLAEVVNDARTLSGEQQHEILLDADGSLEMLWRPEELRCVFSNLVFNAVRHTPGRTRVQVSWLGEGDGATFRVNDSGPGIASRHIPRLVERFYRVDAGRSRESGGTGLGLSIAHQVMQRCGGSLEISSTEGRGATFLCRFPAQRLNRSGENTLEGEKDDRRQHAAHRQRNDP